MLLLFSEYTTNKQLTLYLYAIYIHRATSLWNEEPDSNKETDGLPNVLTFV